ncbi:hypothetical protein BFF78_08385 [Streptomyces fodineus]|uniref:Uncharacterized protein n=2 Tax=Streptomyces fodineus TaxID=1904616 RepID=A0A1D7Y6B2_9ACTN|nr:hypothetical protein BFF78_08385 [Streptomyces fodineus]
MLTTLTAARADLPLAPRLTAPPIPITFTLGTRDVRAIGLTHARRPPLAVKPAQLGTATDPALHCPLGNGTDAAAWRALQALTAHLKVGIPETGRHT